MSVKGDQQIKSTQFHFPEVVFIKRGMSSCLRHQQQTATWSWTENWDHTLSERMNLWNENLHGQKLVYNLCYNTRFHTNVAKTDCYTVLGLLHRLNLCWSRVCVSSADSEWHCSTNKADKVLRNILLPERQTYSTTVTMAVIETNNRF